MSRYLVVIDEKSPLRSHLQTLVTQLGGNKYYSITTQEARTRLTPEYLNSFPPGTELIFIDFSLKDFNYEKEAVEGYGRTAWLLIPRTSSSSIPFKGEPLSSDVIGVVGSFLEPKEIKTAQMVSRSFHKPMTAAYEKLYREAWRRLALAPQFDEKLVGSFVEFYQPDVPAEKLENAYRSYLTFLTGPIYDQWDAMLRSSLNLQLRNIGFVFSQPQIQRLLEHLFPEEIKNIRSDPQFKSPSDPDADAEFSGFIDGLFRGALERRNLDSILFLFRIDRHPDSITDYIGWAIRAGETDIAEKLMLFPTLDEEGKIKPAYFDSDEDFDGTMRWAIEGYTMDHSDGFDAEIFGPAPDRRTIVPEIKRIIKWAIEMGWRPSSPLEDKTKLIPGIQEYIAEQIKMAGPPRLGRVYEEEK